MRKRTSFIKLIRLWGVIFLTALAGVIIGIDLFTNYHDFNIRMDNMRTNYVEQQKQASKREVERVVNMINNERTQSLLTDEQIKAEWMERINNIRFGTNSNGYLFAGSWAGISLAHGAQPDLIGTDIFNFEDSRGNKTSQLLIAASKIKGGGFVPFWWRKPDTGEESSKITYTKGIPDWEMLIAAGVYFDDIEQDIIILRDELNNQTKIKIIILVIFIVVAFSLFLILFNLLSDRLKKDFNLFFAFFDQAAFSDKKIDRKTVQYVELDQMAAYANKMLQDKTTAQQDLLDEREQLEEDVRLRTLDLTAANKELEAFSYSVSHDLRAPLRAIDGFARILLEDHAESLDQDGKRILSVIGSNVQKMGRLIDDLLAFSRLDRKKIKTSNIDMNQLTDELIGELNVDFGKRVVNFNTNSLPDSNGDCAMLREVLFNLMSNALKFTRGKNPAMIEITGKADDDELIYSISDNGVGFDMKYADKLFKVFQRLHSTKEFEGTGIGLALARRIVRKHGGRIWAEGKVGKGAIFYFSLPKKRRNNE